MCFDVTTLNATVLCFIPESTHNEVDSFSEAVKTALDNGKTTFEFGGTEFTMMFNSKGHVKLTLVIIPLGDPLPKVFADNLLRLEHVQIRCPLPATLVPEPDWYVDYNVGHCVVDVAGEYFGKPGIYAVGKNDKLSDEQLFSAITDLFIGVMSGEIIHSDVAPGAIMRRT